MKILQKDSSERRICALLAGVVRFGKEAERCRQEDVEKGREKGYIMDLIYEV